MPQFIFVPNHDGATFIAEGHGHALTDLRQALATALTDRPKADAQRHAAEARLTETWYSEQGGFGHDCSAHADVPKGLWSPDCGTFRSVTVAAGIPPAAAVERAR